MTDTNDIPELSDNANKVTLPDVLLAESMCESRDAVIDRLVKLVIDYDKMLISNQDVLGDYCDLIPRTDQALAKAKEIKGKTMKRGKK